MNSPISWQFANAEHAVMWSADVLRQRRLPRLTSLWREIPANEETLAEVAALTPWGEELTFHLPQDPEERYALALMVEQALATLGEPGELLHLHAWGDWHTELALKGALAIQERARRNGQRIRLNYRYSYRQLGLILRVDHKTAAKRIREALQQLSETLSTTNLIFLPGQSLQESLPQPPCI